MENMSTILMSDYQKGGTTIMKKFLVIMIIGIMVLSVISASGKAEVSESPTLRVGLLPFAGSVPASYAAENGWFKDAGLNLKFDIFPTGAPMNEALAAGRIDIAIIGLAGVYAMANGEVTCVLDTNKASGGNGVYTLPSSPMASQKGNVPGKPNVLGSVETIKGKTFLTQLGTGSQNMLNAYLAQFGLTQKDVNVVHIETGQDYQALLAGRADASALMVPYSFQAEAEGMVRLGHDEDVLGYMTPDVMLVRNKIMDSYRSEIVEFVKVYLKAAEALDSDYQLRYDFSNSYFKNAGREYTHEALDQDVRVRVFVTEKYMSNPIYKFGEGMYRTANFFVGAGQILPEKLPNVLKSIDPSVVKDATGFNIPIFKP